MIKIMNSYLKSLLFEEKEEYLENDFDDITEIVIDYDDVSDIDLSELKFFNNLNSITFINYIIDSNVIENLIPLERLNDLYFKNCKILNFSLIDNLKIKSLYFDNCNNDELFYINNIDNLESLFFDNMQEVDLKEISIIKKVKELSLQNTNVLNEKYLIYMNEIEKLAINDSTICDLSFLLAMERLKYLVVDKKQASASKNIILELIKNNVIVVDFMNQSIGEYYE